MKSNTKIKYLFILIILIHLCISCQIQREGLLMEIIMPQIKKKKNKNNMAGRFASFLYSDTKNASSDEDFLGLLMYSFLKLIALIVVMPPILLVLCMMAVGFAGFPLLFQGGNALYKKLTNRQTV